MTPMSILSHGSLGFEILSISETAVLAVTVFQFQLAFFRRRKNSTVRSGELDNR
jgi:hypothetical protein